MNITKIHLHNFRQYKNTRPINVNVNGKGKNLILFYGENGSGKSTIMEAIQFALLGKRILNLEAIPHKEYNDYLKSVVNDDADIKKNRAYVQLDLELNNFQKMSVLREIVLENGKHQDKITLLNGSSPTELIPEHYWEDYLSTLVPTEVSEFFFLDGEVIKEVIKKAKSDELIRNSSKILMGFTKLNNLQRDLGTLAEDIALRTVKNKKLENSLGRTNKKIKEFKKEKKRIQEEINTIQEKIRKLEKQLEKVEKETRLKMGLGVRAHSKKETDLFKIIEKEKEQSDQLNELCEINLTLALGKDVKDSALLKLNKLIKKDQLFFSETEKNQLQRLINKSIKKKLKKGYNKTNINKISHAITESIDELQSIEDQIPYARGFSKSELNEIHGLIKSISEDELVNEIKDIYSIRDKLNHKKLKEMNKKVNKDIQKFLEDTKTLQEELSVKETTVIAKLEELKEIGRKLTELELKKTKYEDTLFNLIVENKRLDACIAAQDVIEQYMKKLLSAKANEMSDAITTIHGEIAHKSDMVKSIKIEPETLDTKIIGKNGRVIPPHRLSTGESEVFHLSVLWGLTTISQNKLPILIDAPFEKLDHKHVKNLVTKLLPKMSNQTLLFVHDRELDNKTVKAIKPSILKAYHVRRKSSEEGSKLTNKQLKNWRAN